MQVHRQPRQRLLVVPHLRVLAAEVAAYGGCPSHDTLVHWLIDCGEIEAAATDALCPRHDATNPLTWTFRAATRSIADAVTASWLHRPDYVMAALDEFKRALCGVLELPRRRAIEAINRPISHGYAYHSLTPETFIHAALTLRRRFKPRRAFIVGLRGAGTSLSAIVASTLTIRGVICESLTVRAHNEAIAPYVDLDPALLHRWRSYEDAVFIVVGEGPDETGGTFAAAIDTLLHAGADPQRVIVVSSAPLDDAKQASPRTRALFARVQQVSSSFEEAWLDTQRLIGPSDATDLSLREVSNGAWRADSLITSGAWPAVQPRHERRKYRFANSHVEGGWLKWIGLGRYGAAHRTRAMLLADWGFAPKPIDSAHGFLKLPHVVGRPLRLDSRPRGIVQVMADYLACIVSDCRSPIEAPLGRFEIAQMLRENVEDGLGSSWKRWAAQLIRASPPGDARPIIVRPDARMQPHEWIETPSGFVKTDGFEHHDDPFFPGTTDIAWDVAGTCIEWRFTRFEEEAFLARYRVRSGDHSIATRLPFFRAGYAAFRLGYATLAGEALAESTDDADIADAARFAALRQQYARALRRELRAVKPAPPSLNHATSPYIRTAGVGGSYSTSADDPHGRPQTG
jgi:hypothetical protein